MPLLGLLQVKHVAAVQTMGNKFKIMFPKRLSGLNKLQGLQSKLKGWWHMLCQLLDV